MPGGRATAIALAFLALTSPTALSWTEAGGGSTDAYSFTGRVPVAEEIAFRAQMPADMLASGGNREPLLLGGAAYVVTTEGIQRVSLEDGSNDTLVAMDGIDKIVSDGERLFAKRGNTILAFDLQGNGLWETPIPRVIASPPEYNRCPMTVGGGSVYAYCWQQAIALSDCVVLFVCASDSGGDSDVILLAIDAASGERQWSRALYADAAPGARAAQLASDGYSRSPAALLYTAGWLVSYQFDTASGGGAERRSLSIHDAATGETAHYIPSAEEPRADPTNLAPDVDAYCRPHTPGVDAVQLSGRWQGPVAAGQSVYAMLEDLTRVRVDTGQVEMEAPYDEGLHNPRWAMQPGGGLVNAHGLTLQSIDESGARSPIYELDGAKMWHWLGAAPGAVVAIAHDMGRAFPCTVLEDPEENSDGQQGRKQWLHVVLDDGAHWTHEFFSVGEGGSSVDADAALADGVIVVAAHPRTLLVFGRTSASIAPSLAVRDAYPAAGEAVVIDLSETKPGLHAPDLEFRADWGDGTVGEWQSSPLLTHAYASDGTFAANLTARNSAGQQSVERATFHVGAVAPVEPNFIEWAFDTERQDTTFFVLGGAGTALIALFGLVLAKRRRSLLQEELLAVDAAAGSADADRLLDAAQTRATMYYRERRLDEAQFAVLREHIDKARNTARLGSLDAITAHLPHGVVLALRQVLSDGRVNVWEERHVLSLLPADTPPHVAAQVRDALARWRQHDTQDAWGRA